MLDKFESTQIDKMAAEYPNIRVLLVENDEVNIFVMEKILSKHFHFTIARNGIEALHLVHKNSYDIILCDIDLGHSMDGTEVLEEIRKDPLNDNTKVWVVTGIGLPDDDAYFLSLGFGKFFHKPIDFNHLVEQIKAELPEKVLT